MEENGTENHGTGMVTSFNIVFLKAINILKYNKHKRIGCQKSRVLAES